MAARSSSRSQDVSPQSALESPGLSAQRLEQRRQRAVRACQVCRARRVRCDNGKPKCSACVRASVECIQTQGAGTTVIDTGTHVILQRIDDLENTLRSFQRLGDQPQEIVKIPTTPRTSRLHITTEELLSWEVFNGNYNDSRDLKALWRSSRRPDGATPHTTTESSPISGRVDSYSSNFLVDQFFNHVHVKNPMLNESKVRQMVHRLSVDGPTWEPSSCLALLICALGSIASSFDTIGSPQPNSQPMVVANSYFSAAKRCIGALSGAGGVIEAQCYFYSGVYLMTIIQPLRAWRCFTQALASCQDFECTDPSYQNISNQSSPAQKDLPSEECVYWSCWKSERELRTCLRLPDFAAGDLSYPMLFPTPPEGLEGAQAASWYFYLSEISLRRLEHRCREEIDKVLNGGEASLIEDLSTSTKTLEELSLQWVETLPPAMSLQTPQERDDVLKFILRGHLLNLWEVIYWPWLEIWINQGLHDEKCYLYIHKALKIAADRIRINKPGFHHRHHGTWLMLQSCTRSALILIAANLDRGASSMLPHVWRDAVSDAIDLLRFWQYEGPDIAHRLRILEELVKRIPD